MQVVDLSGVYSSEPEARRQLVDATAGRIRQSRGIFLGQQSLQRPQATQRNTQTEYQAGQRMRLSGGSKRDPGGAGPSAHFRVVACAIRPRHRYAIHRGGNAISTGMGGHPDDGAPVAAGSRPHPCAPVAPVQLVGCGAALRGCSPRFIALFGIVAPRWGMTFANNEVTQ